MKKVFEFKQNNHLLTSQAAMNQVCDNLFQHSDIGFFCYKKVYKNDQEICLSTHSQFSQKVAEYGFSSGFNQTKQIKASTHKIRGNQSHFMLRDANPEAYTMSRNFNIGNVLAMSENHGEYIDTFVYGGKADKDILDDYLYHFDIFNMFKYYFLEQAQTLVEEAHHTLVLPPRLQKINEDQFIGATAELEQLITPKRFMVNVNGLAAYVTPRELSCLHLLANGKTIKEIAANLGISSKTVNVYLERIKLRLGIHTKAALIEVYYASSLSDVVL